MSSDARTFPLEAPPVTAAKRSLPWLRAARVSHWAHFLVLPLGGLDLTLGLGASALALMRGVGIAFAVLAFGYSLNGIADRHMDEGDKNPLVAVEPSTKHYGALVVLTLMALGLALTGPLVVLLATLTCLTSGVVYSVGPRLKRVPLVGTLLNATSFAPLLWVGVDGPVGGLWLLTLAFSALLLQNQLLHEAADRSEDRRGALRTTLLVLGSRGSAVLAALLGFALALTAAQTDALAWLFAPLLLVHGLLVPAGLALRGDDPDAMARARVGHRFLSIATGALVFASVRL